MATITISAPQELDALRREHPEVNWNRVIKRRILERLDDLKKFEQLKSAGRL